MKNKIIYGSIAIIFIVSIVITFVKGINVDIYYGEGDIISFTEKDTININDVREIAKEIWGNNCIVQNMEFFNDSAEIKVREFNDEQLNQLKDKINEKYSSELKIEDFEIEHVSNVKIRTLVEPYIIPVGLSLLIIILFYAIRYRGARKMLELLLYLAIAEGLLYSVYAIIRIPFSSITIPLGMCLYALTVLIFTAKLENSSEPEDEEE